VRELIYGSLLDVLLIFKFNIIKQKNRSIYYQKAIKATERHLESDINLLMLFGRLEFYTQPNLTWKSEDSLFA